LVQMSVVVLTKKWFSHCPKPQNIYKNALAAGLCPDPIGKLTAFFDLLAGLGGNFPTERERGGQEERGENEKGG